MYVFWKWDSKMCILMVILRGITINYSHRALIINFSLHFCFFMVNYWGDDCTGHPPTWNIGGGGDISPPPPSPGSTPMTTCTLYKLDQIRNVILFFKERAYIGCGLNPFGSVHLDIVASLMKKKMFTLWILHLKRQLIYFTLWTI